MNAPVLKFVMGSVEPTFKDLDRVRLLKAVSTDAEVSVPAGTVGTVVGVWADGVAYEVEFSDEYRGLATINANGLALELQPE